MNATTIVKPLALCALAGFAVAALPSISEARIKLATLPKKEAVQIRMDHPSYVMVEEERVIALQKNDPTRGEFNTVDFSWAGTTIDKSSIVFRPVDANSPVVVLSTSYPPGENALTWAVFSPEARSERFRVSYLMGAIGRETSYHVLVSADESKATLKHFFKITNQSGETFTDATFTTESGKGFERSIENGEARQVLVRRYDEVKLLKEYVYNTRRDREKVFTDYVLKNSREVGLGQGPFQYGKVRIYQEDGKGGSAFMGEDWGQFTPMGDDMRLNIGTAQDIKVERKQMKDDRANIRGNVYDTDEVVTYEIKNFKKEAVKVKVIDYVAGEWEYMNDSSDKIAKRENAEEVHFEVMVPPGGEPYTLRFHYQRKNVW